MLKKIEYDGIYFTNGACGLLYGKIIQFFLHSDPLKLSPYDPNLVSFCPEGSTERNIFPSPLAAQRYIASFSLCTELLYCSQEDNKYIRETHY
jgi:hypothetical protein